MECPRYLAHRADQGMRRGVSSVGPMTGASATPNATATRMRPPTKSHVPRLAKSAAAASSPPAGSPTKATGRAQPRSVAGPGQCAANTKAVVNAANPATRPDDGSVVTLAGPTTTHTTARPLTHTQRVAAARTARPMPARARLSCSAGVADSAATMAAALPSTAAATAACHFGGAGIERIDHHGRVAAAAQAADQRDRVFSQQRRENDDQRARREDRPGQQVEPRLDEPG